MIKKVAVRRVLLFFFMDQSEREINFIYPINFSNSNVWKGNNESGQSFSIGLPGISQVRFKSCHLDYKTSELQFLRYNTVLWKNGVGQLKYKQKAQKILKFQRSQGRQKSKHFTQGTYMAQNFMPKRQLFSFL